VDAPRDQVSGSLDFLAGDGEMARLMRAWDWSTSSLGPPETWPQPLRTAVRTLLNTGHPMYVFWGPHGACLYNDAYRQSLGPERHPGSLGRPAREVWEEVWDAIGWQIEQVMNGGPATWHENQKLTTTRHGRQEDVYWTYSYGPIDDERAPGGVGGVLVVCTETTSQVLATRALAAERRQFAELFERSPSFMTLLRGPKHRFELVNPAYRQLIAHRDVIGMEVRQAFSEVEGQGFFELLDTVFTTGEAYQGRAVPFTMQRTSGARPERRFLDFVYQPTRGPDGVVDGIFVEGVDVTDGQRAIEALAEMNATLERQVETRTAELMAVEEALRQSQKMEAVGQLTGGIAHDFNNLLAGITGSLELLQMRVRQGRLDAVPRYVDAAQGAAKRAAVLTQRLLAFSRRQTLDPRPVNLNRLVAEMEELVRRTVGPAIDMEVVGAGGLWLTLVDPGQLENALLNLCINARDAMPDGGRLTIETANRWLDDRAARDRDLPPGQYVSLCVTDTGTGMTPEVASKAFDPFFTTKPVGQGTGLGLSMIYGFARQSGGQVRIYSELGIGTTLCIYLPRYFGDDAEAAEASRQSHAGFGAGESVLVVDDEPTVRMLIVDVLQEQGYRAVEAHDGPAALQVLASGARIDLLITDVGLPGGLNGRQIADAGRLSRPDLKVLFVTGYAENAVIGAGHLDPGMQIITKPFAIDALSAKIQQMLDRT
jgi:signal transduction histidine kinase